MLCFLACACLSQTAVLSLHHEHEVSQPLVASCPMCAMLSCLCVSVCLSQVAVLSLQHDPSSLAAIGMVASCPMHAHGSMCAAVSLADCVCVRFAGQQGRHIKGAGGS